MNARELLNALDAFEQEKGISKDIVVDALKEALEKAYKKNDMHLYSPAQLSTPTTHSTLVGSLPTLLNLQYFFSHLSYVSTPYNCNQIPSLLLLSHTPVPIFLK